MPPLRPLNLNLRLLSNKPLHRLSSTFTSRPAPPKLPAAQQAEFERLQRAAAVSSAFQDIQAQTQTPPSTESPRHATNVAAASSKNNSSDGESSLNQGLFRGAPPEFEGDTNPKTGEVGGAQE
ncbi:uncharacterized protein TrAtP1_010354 [Trichoderma atroviride]|uniref:uncharacterized protein n=1 Tax=Hypocrea atroviridis TaxID=63577 RepID=UPI00331C5DFD|nr:hypothetical protein TrAtP1_010354 [Trichoderma atroviride]